MDSERQGSFGKEELSLFLPQPDHTEDESHRYRRRLQYLIPHFGFHLPAGHEWFRSEQDALMFLEATANHLGKTIHTLSKHNLAPLFLDLFDKACNLYKMRLPFAQRPMHVNSAIGLNYAEVCAHKSDAVHEHREKTKTSQEKQLEEMDSKNVYKGVDREKLRSGYWFELHEKSVIGKYVTKFSGREMEEITRHIILSVLEGSPEFYYLRQPERIIVPIKNSSITKERTLVREKKASINCSKLAEVVRELHRQFLRHDDTEIAEFADETELDDIRLQHPQATPKLTQGSTSGPTSTRLSAAPYKVAAPARKAPLLAPGCESQKAPNLSANDRRRVRRGLKPMGQANKRKAGDSAVSEVKRPRHGRLEAKLMGDLPIRSRVPQESKVMGDLPIRKK
ncbi:hypothetical protein VPNG_08356 [Cytospora leucostoma]|uniref:Uncharacterized protein n=1 Tax=Cytospora leucostoma TaxID=1230097 RepID=A0A423W9L2_9PEZI|nr:hypothetical protein VPNG_08356 [Cytospora leucostoma]